MGFPRLASACEVNFPVLTTRVTRFGEILTKLLNSLAILKAAFSMWQNVEPILTKMLDYKDFSCDYLPTYLPTNLGGKNQIKAHCREWLIIQNVGHEIAKGLPVSLCTEIFNRV